MLRSGHLPGTRTVGVFLFGLVNERIGGDKRPIHASSASGTQRGLNLSDPGE